MPCWYYDKPELRNSPSFRDGIDPATEARYRREGARFILDTGTKMGLYPVDKIRYALTKKNNIIFCAGKALSSALSSEQGITRESQI